LNIRTHLRALIITTLIPIAIFGAAGAYILVKKERDIFERGARDRVRALMTAIDAQLRSSITPLELLARSPSLEQDDLLAFRKEAERALAARQADWLNILLADATSARTLMNVRVAHDAPLPAPFDASSILESARTGLPTVSKVAVGSMKRLAFAVRVPVTVDGRIKYVLSATVDTATIERLIDRQAFPNDWTVAVLDGARGFVVRRPQTDVAIASASESLIKALDSAREGWQRGRLADGTEIYRAFQHSSFSRWAASIAVPRSYVEGSLRTLWVLFAAFAAAAVLGLYVALKLAERISEPIVALAAAAPALGRGEDSGLSVVESVDEVRALSRALTDASLAIREREERQRVAQQALRTADRAKDEFLAMLAHELRNPLASMSNVAQLLKIAGDQPQVLEKVSDILSRQVEHMTRLVDDLLEVGRVTGGKVRLQCAPLDLAAVTVEIVDTWKRSGRFVHHHVQTDLQSAWVSADRSRMEQVITNLLDNALKYTPAAGRIVVTVNTQNGDAVLAVSDTGEGIAPELIDRVFDLFVQGERSLARELGGLGIGLTMAKRLVTLHGGTISAASAGAHKGATFTVVLPGIERPPALASVKPAAQEDMRSRRVLIIEDNVDARESLAALLRLKGHEVYAAENGATGMKLAASALPDMIVIDIGLPDVDGYKLAKRMHSDPVLSLVRLVALTGYGTREDRDRAIAAGFDEHLVKPVELDALEAVFAQLPPQHSVPAQSRSG
jgi:signal transduction histidine kinase/CheY-like chemotaxis protein